jgi:apolipoprotein N-acyltransferase
VHVSLFKSTGARSRVLLATALAGFVHGLAFGATHPAALQWPAFASLGGIVFLLRSQRQWPLLLLCCALFWLASYAVGLRWIAEALVAPESLGIPLGSLVYGMLVVGLACASILSLWLAVVVSAPLRSDVLYCATLSSALLCGDLLRELLLPSFPWLSVGYAHIEGPFAALLPLVGVRGTGWFAQGTALFSGALVFSFRTRQPVLTLAALVGVALILPRTIPAATQERGSLRVAAYQTAVSPKDKFRASLFGRHLQDIGDFTRNQTAQLVVTPETAVPTSLRALTPAQEHFLEASVSATRALLFGAFSEDSREDVFNSAVLFQRASNNLQRTVYIKQHLAPIGEYAPPGFGWITDLLGFPITNLRSTEDPPQNFLVDDTTIIPSICQDLLYGDDLRTTTTSPRLLVNLSNVAFFKGSLVQAQLLNIARARALEQQIPVLIAANYGPTAFINASGVVERELPASLSGSLEVTVHPRSGTTLYARCGNALSDLIAGLTLATAALAPLLSRWSRPPSGGFRETCGSSASDGGS